MHERRFDVVLFGATGFTGRLVAEYLLRRGGARLALAGRDREKLAALARELGSDAPILVGDAHDPASLEKIAAETKVVCTTVGPYARYGSPLVAACAARGTDYCDLAGETQWVRRMIDAHHAEAGRSGARIVPCCGFDSIPSDLGVQLLQAHARAAHGAPCASITLAVRHLRGGASGGSMASLISMIDETKRDPDVRRVFGDPYALNPPGERTGPDRPDLRGIAFRPHLGAWTAPFIMAGINTRVVRRTNALASYPYGRNFRYEEVTAFPRGALGFARAAALAGGLGAFLGAAQVDPVRRFLVRYVLPRPGQGPSREARERGSFVMALTGQGTDAAGRPFAVQGEVGGKGDPGYAATAPMLGESALSLAQDERTTGGGVLTPAFAMGERLLARLRAAGMTWRAEG